MESVLSFHICVGFRAQTYGAGSIDDFLNILYSFAQSAHWGINIGLQCIFKMNFVNEAMHGT